MPTSVLPALRKSLITGLAAQMPSTLVLSGGGTTDDPGDYVMVGIDDPDTPDWFNMADELQDPASDGPPSGSRDENGAIYCVALSWNGDNDLDAAVDALFSNLAVIENYLRSTPRAGVDDTDYPTFWCWYGGLQSPLQGQQDSDGAKARAVFKVNFFARI